MKKKDIVIGETYIVKVSGKLAHVRITGESPYGGWDGINVATRRAIRIRSAARLRRPAALQMKRTTCPDCGGPLTANSVYPPAIHSCPTCPKKEPKP